MLDHNTWADAEPGVFYQASVQKDHRSKIRNTITRLKEFGRNIDQLIYVTSQKIGVIDAEERLLGKETGILIRIRDGAYLASHVNSTPQTRGAFRDFIGPHLEFLKHIGSAQSVGPSQHVPPPTTWESYIQQFCTPARVGKRDGLEELRRYLQSSFKMEYEARKDIEDLVSDSQSKADLERITSSLKPHKAADELARNDALLALAVYRRRHAKSEYSKATEFGYRTWWLRLPEGL